MWCSPRITNVWISGLGVPLKNVEGRYICAGAAGWREAEAMDRALCCRRVAAAELDSLRDADADFHSVVVRWTYELRRGEAATTDNSAYGRRVRLHIRYFRYVGDSCSAHRDDRYVSARSGHDLRQRTGPDFR